MTMERIVYTYLFAASGVLCSNICDLPANVDYKYTALTAGENLTAVVTYSLYCTAEDYYLYPIGQDSTIQCSKDNGMWLISNNSKHIEVNDLKCVKDCIEPTTVHNGNYQVASLLKSGSRITDLQGTLYRPGVQISFYCDEGYIVQGRNMTTCSNNGDWIPPFPTCEPESLLHGSTTSYADVDGTNLTSELIAIIVGVSVFVPLLIFMIALAICKARRCKGVCRKRRAPSNHPDDADYPHGYTQLGSGPLLPSYEEAVQGSNQDSINFNGVYRPTTTSDYRQLSSLESSSRGELDSISNGTHRHSLFSGSSGHYYGDTTSGVLAGDGLSMSDASTLVTVNTYESQTSYSSPANSRRGMAGSVNSRDTMDDAPLIVSSSSDHDEGDRDIESSVPVTHS